MFALLQVLQDDGQLLQSCCIPHHGLRFAVLYCGLAGALCASHMCTYVPLQASLEMVSCSWRGGMTGGHAVLLLPHHP